MADTIRAVSLHQPWADLIAFGHKTIETRGWVTHYRGRILLCAAKRWDKVCRLIASKYSDPGPHPDSLWDRPLFPPDYQPRLGVVLARAILADCRPMTAGDRKAAGFFKSWGTEGKWSWVLSEIEPVAPAPIKGAQGLFDPTKQGIGWDDLEPLQLTLF